MDRSLQGECKPSRHGWQGQPLPFAILSWAGHLPLRSPPTNTPVLMPSWQRRATAVVGRVRGRGQEGQMARRGVSAHLKPSAGRGREPEAKLRVSSLVPWDLTHKPKQKFKIKLLKCSRWRSLSMKPQALPAWDTV